jgi:hypothetical protein
VPQQNINRVMMMMMHNIKRYVCSLIKSNEIQFFTSPKRLKIISIKDKKFRRVLDNISYIKEDRVQEKLLSK